MKIEFETKRVLTTFNNRVEDWDSKVKFIAEKDGESRRLFRVLDDVINEKDRVLDIGCGTGKVGIYLKRKLRNTEVVCIDISLSMLKNVQDKLGDSFCMLSDAGKLGLRSDLFDMVTCQQVLHHLSEPVNALKSIFRVIKPGGYFLGLTVGPDYQNKIFPYANTTMTEDPLGRVSNNEIKEYITTSGFCLRTLVNDYFTFTFESFENYFNFLLSIGSAHRIHKYHQPLDSYRCNLKERLDSEGILKNNGSLTLRGHYITILAQKPVHKET